MTLSPLFLSLPSFFSIYILLFPFTVSVSAQTLNSTELSALYSLRSSLSLRARDWPRKADPCSNWTGVKCRSSRVVSLSIAGLRRTRLGQLDPQFAVDGLQNLSSLSTFNASGFLLPGPIPVWFGRKLAPGFSILDLGSTGINGTIPSELGLLTSLKTLVLSHNNLTDKVPIQLGNLSSLNHLDLSFNNLSGGIPTSIWSLNEVNYLDFSSNQLTGEIPDSFPNQSISLSFNLSNNQYYGSISSKIEALLKRFNLFDISNNYFEGSINISTNANNDTWISMNCLKNVFNQRNQSDCGEFYKQKGLPFDQSTALPPAQEPSLEPTSSLTNKKRNNNWKYILAGVLGGIGLIIILTLSVLIILCLIRRSRRRTSPNSRRRSSVSAVQSSPVAATPLSPVTPKNTSAVADSFTYDQLLLATSEFSNEKLLKNGHTGDIYHAVLGDGVHVAVKRVDVNTVKNENYLTELGIFAKVSNTRLVPFLGRCTKDESEDLLVYKFMPKGDLTSALHKKHRNGEEEDGLPSLDWITRLKIARGVAEALCFLHHECNPPLVHRDIQASSVLLDDKFEVRLGSLSEICPQQANGSHSVLSRILRSSKSLDKSMSGPPATCSYDILCFGKVLLELVTGKLGISGSDDPATAEWIETTLNQITIHERDLIMKIIDPSLFLYEDLLEEVWAMAIVAKSCLNPRSSKRPPARYILKALENPLRVVREEERSNLSSARLATVSSRSSWHGAFRDSWRQGGSSEIAASFSGRIREERSFRILSFNKSHGSGDGGERSLSYKRSSREIVPEPLVFDNGGEIVDD